MWGHGGWPTHAEGARAAPNPPPAREPACPPLGVQRKEALRNLSPDELLALRWYARNRLEALKKALDTGSYVDPDPLNGGVRCVRSACCWKGQPGRQRWDGLCAALAGSKAGGGSCWCARSQQSAAGCSGGGVWVR